MTPLDLLYIIPILMFYIYIKKKAHLIEEEEDNRYLSRHAGRDVPYSSRYDGFFKRHISKFLLIFLFTMPIWFGPVTERLLPSKKIPSTLENYRLYEAQCLRVYDGDTIKVKNIKLIPPAKYNEYNSNAGNNNPQYKFNQEEKVRYLGYNSPDPGRNDPETKEVYHIYAESSKKNSEFVLGKKVVLLVRKSYGVRDDYDRILAYVYAPKEGGESNAYFGVTQKLLELELGDTRYGSPDPELPETIKFSY